MINPITNTLRPGVRPTQLSPPAIESYGRCPKQFYLRYVERESVTFELTPNSVVGIAVHQGLHRFYGIGALEDRTVKHLRLCYQAAWGEQRRRQEVFVSEAEEAHYGMRGWGMLDTYASAFDLTSRPLSRELSIEILLKTIGCRLCGRVDRIDDPTDGPLEVIDYKTGRRAATPEELRDDFAALAYTVMVSVSLKRPVQRFSHHYVALGQTVSVDFEAEDLEPAKDEVCRRVGEALDAESYPATPGAQCRWCPFAATCAERDATRIADLFVPSDVPF